MALEAVRILSRYGRHDIKPRRLSSLATLNNHSFFHAHQVLPRYTSSSCSTATSFSTFPTQNIVSHESSTSNTTRKIVSSPPPIEEEILGPKKDAPTILFPWRHETSLLDRLTPGTLDYVTKGHLLSTTKMKPGNATLNTYATAYMFLDVPWYSLVFGSSWKSELTDSMAWAFSQGVAGLLSNLYQGESL
jgi:hypothetical protein